MRRDVCVVEWGKKMKNFGKNSPGSRARSCQYWHGPCQLSVKMEVWLGKVWHGCASLSTSRAKFLEFWSSKIFIFLNCNWTITCKITKNNEKQTK